MGFYEGFEKRAAYDRPMRNIPEYLQTDPIHSWRASKGIELIHREPTKKELYRIKKNWDQMSPEQKRVSDVKSKELFGVTNLENYKKLLSEKWAVS